MISVEFYGRAKTVQLTWIADDDENPSNEANATVEAESSTWRHPFHHTQESRCDDDVRAPACHCVHHCAQRSYFQRDELSANPGYGCYS